VERPPRSRAWGRVKSPSLSIARRPGSSLGGLSDENEGAVPVGCPARNLGRVPTSRSVDVVPAGVMTALGARVVLTRTVRGGETGLSRTGRESSLGRASRWGGAVLGNPPEPGANRLRSSLRSRLTEPGGDLGGPSSPRQRKARVLVEGE